ncbi:MAG: hypothetical protein Q8O61_08320, partial [Nocardioides sp.]|nr:hypothetical protein [Nocardioides sp.]
MNAHSRTRLLLMGALTAALTVSLSAFGASAQQPSQDRKADPSDGWTRSVVKIDRSRLGTPQGGPAVRMKERARSTPVRKVQRVTLKWKGTWRKPRYERSAVVPGIGNIKLVCKPSSTMIRLYAANRDA